MVKNKKKKQGNTLSPRQKKIEIFLAIFVPLFVLLSTFSVTLGCSYSCRSENPVPTPSKPVYINNQTIHQNDDKYFLPIGTGVFLTLGTQVSLTETRREGPNIYFNTLCALLDIQKLSEDNDNATTFIVDGEINYGFLVPHDMDFNLFGINGAVDYINNAPTPGAKFVRPATGAIFVGTLSAPPQNASYSKSLYIDSSISFVINNDSEDSTTFGFAATGTTKEGQYTIKSNFTINGTGTCFGVFIQGGIPLVPKRSLESDIEAALPSANLFVDSKNIIFSKNGPGYGVYISFASNYSTIIVQGVWNLSCYGDESNYLSLFGFYSNRFDYRYLRVGGQWNINYLSDSDGKGSPSPRAVQPAYCIGLGFLSDLGAECNVNIGGVWNIVQQIVTDSPFTTAGMRIGSTEAVTNVTNRQINVYGIFYINSKQKGVYGGDKSDQVFGLLIDVIKSVEINITGFFSIYATMSVDAFYFASCDNLNLNFDGVVNIFNPIGYSVDDKSPFSTILTVDEIIDGATFKLNGIATIKAQAPRYVSIKYQGSGDVSIAITLNTVINFIVEEEKDKEVDSIFDVSDNGVISCEGISFGDRSFFFVNNDGFIGNDSSNLKFANQVSKETNTFLTINGSLVDEDWLDNKPGTDVTSSIAFIRDNVTHEQMSTTTVRALLEEPTSFFLFYIESWTVEGVNNPFFYYVALKYQITEYMRRALCEQIAFPMLNILYTMIPVENSK